MASMYSRDYVDSVVVWAEARVTGAAPVALETHLEFSSHVVDYGKDRVDHDCVVLRRPLAAGPLQRR